MTAHYKKYSKNVFFISCIFIFLIGFILRFYNYPNRWILAYDQAHDATIARYALETHKLPLLGPFSSGGPFQTGGEWYWFIMFFILLYPPSLLSPWVGLTFLYTIFILFMIVFAREFIDKKYAILVGLLTSLSYAQISQGVNLTNQAPQAILSLFAIWSAIHFIRTNKYYFLFFSAFSIGIATSIHLQGLAMIPLVIITSIFMLLTQYKKSSPSLIMLSVFKSIVAIFLGFFLPWIPVLIVDLHNNFYNTQSMINYFLHGQTVPFEVLGRRWLTYLLVFWPEEWSLIVGGNYIISYSLIILSGVFLGIKLIQKNLPREWIIILGGFVSGLIILRYTRTPLFSSYLVFTHPYVFLISAFPLYLLLQKSRYIGLALISIVLVGGLLKVLPTIQTASNSTYELVNGWQQKLVEKFPDSTFALYDYNFETRDKTMPLVYLLYSNKLIADNGMQIGVTRAGYSGKEPTIYEDHTYKLVDLRGSKQEGDPWGILIPSIVYFSTEEWYTQKK